MKNKSFMTTVAAIFLIALATLSCGKQTTSGANPEGDGKGQEDTIPSNPDTPKSVRILFTGNSLTYYGDVVVDKSGSPTNEKGVFEKIAEDYGSNVKVTNFTYGSAGFIDGRSKASTDGLSSPLTDYGIYQLLTGLHPHYYGKSSSLDSIYVQDYVFLQQRGANVVDTYNQAKLIASLFPPSTKFVIMLTHYDCNNADVKSAAYKLKKDDGWFLIPWGSLVTDLWNGQIYGMGYSYSKPDFIITSDNIHPNYLTGYITALMSYCTIFGKSAVGAHFSFVKNTLGSYYSSSSETKFPQVLGDSEEMGRIQKCIDAYIAGESISFGTPPYSTSDNVLKGMTIQSDSYFSSYPSGFATKKNVTALTDGVKSYDKNTASTYADFKWQDQTSAKYYADLPHFDANGKETSDGRYLCGFFINLNQLVKVDSLTVYNEKDKMNIDSFDILLSTDGENWNVAYSGNDLATGSKYLIADETTNYVTAKFPAQEARYFKFALAVPRSQNATQAQINAYNAKYGTSITELNANPEYFRLVEMELFKSK